ncbi:uncharacterized protein LOC120480356 [Pimephales promelas]|uniref:uncharacterized protein LOC120480356 n=1 Tax=Pimephales promelas TaxID=90988 RepID=UPI001955982F|nr:uncharacterized protein LOC120480356 [Pimephales promelas]
MQSGEHHLCMFYLTHSELFTQSENSRNLSCDYYIINTEPEIRSPRSDTRTIRGLPQAKLTASASVIEETDTVQLSCENTEYLKMKMCVFNINGRESFSKASSSCQLSLTGSQISIWSEGQSSSVRITCFYTVNKSQVLMPSPHSDPVTISIQISTPAAHVTTTMKTFSTPAAHVTTTMKTSLPLMSTYETYSTTVSKSKLPNSETKKTTLFTATSTQRASPMDTKTAIAAISTTETPTSTTTVSWLLVVLVFTGIVFLSGLMGFICLCPFDSSDDVLTEVIYSSCHVETTSLLCSSKHG